LSLNFGAEVGVRRDTEVTADRVELGRDAVRHHVRLGLEVDHRSEEGVHGSNARNAGSSFRHATQLAVDVETALLGEVIDQRLFRDGDRRLFAVRLRLLFAAGGGPCESKRGRDHHQSSY
jgi:hypothetical protein